MSNNNNRRLYEGLIVDLTCPLTLERFRDPVTVPCCGKSFEREEIVEHLSQNDAQLCPLCNGDLSRFDARNQAKNVVLAALVETLQELTNGAPPDGGGVAVAAPKEHEWTCTATPIVASNTMCELSLNLHNARFQTRPALFVAVMDRSGSMGGLPERQVRAALKHIEALAKTSAHVKLVMLTYGSDCTEIQTAEQYRIDGGTNFRAAFQMVDVVLRRYMCSDEPADAERANNVSMATVVLMTDGQDGSGNRQTLVPEFKEMLAARWGRQPIAVHTVGFSASCDRELLESIRTAGTVDGLYRFAEPGDNDDALCQKLSGIFELSSNASTVPIQLQVVGSVEEPKSVRLEVNAAKHGSYKCWIDFAAGSQLTLQLSSAIDIGVSVPIKVLSPSSFVLERWLAHLVDEMASEVLELSSNDKRASMSTNVRTLCCALLQKKIEAIRCKSADQGVAQRLDYIAQQVEQLQCGNAVNVGKLSDLRFASLFGGAAGDQKSGAGSGAGQHPITLLSTQTLQQTQELLDNKPYYERAPRHYSRNAGTPGRNALQRAIALQLTDATSADVARLIDESTRQDALLHLDADGNNAVMLAAYCGHAKTIKALLAKHAPDIDDLNRCNRHDESAVTLAIKKRGFHYTLGALLDAGAKIVASRLKALERYAIDNQFSITAQIIADRGSSSSTAEAAESKSGGAAPKKIEIDASATPAYVSYMLERALSAADAAVWSKEQFLNVALCKQMLPIAKRLIDECQAKPTLAMLLEHCVPKKPDAPDTPLYIELAQLVLDADPALVNAKTDACIVDTTVNGSGDGQETPLFRAAQKGSLPHVQLFADRGAKIDDPNAKGNTALWVAAFQCYPCIVTELLDRGADINWQNEKGNTPLYGPCTRGSRKVAEQLIAAGARIEQINKNGDTLVLLCCRNGHADVLECLLQYVDDAFVDRKAHIDGFNAIMACAEQDKADCVRVLADYGVNLNQTTDDDNAILARATPLHIAAYYGRLQALGALLERGANADAIDKSGQTPLHIAVIQGNVDAIRLLRRTGNASTSIVDCAGNVPMAYARDRKDVRKALIDPVLDVLMLLARGGFQKDEEAQACQILERHTGVIGCLAPQEIVDVRDYDGSTPLLQAVLHGKLPLVKSLLTLRADASIANSHGMDSVAFATWSKNARIASLFREASPASAAALQRLQQAADADPLDAQTLFLGTRPVVYQARCESGIARRMEEFIATPLQVLPVSDENDEKNEKKKEPLLMIKDAKQWMPRKLDSCALFDAHRDELTQRVWDAKVFTVNKVASSSSAAEKSNLTAREIFTICLATNGATVYSVVNTALLTGNGLEGGGVGGGGGAVRLFASALYAALLKLPVYEGEAFIGSSLAQRKMYTIGQVFKWRHFASASTLWKVALENAPSFTSSARKGVVFIVKSKTARLVGAHSQFSFDAEVLFLPDTVFRVTNWYHGDVIALGQANIRQHTFGVKERDDERLPLAQLMESEKSLIIEVQEEDH